MENSRFTLRIHPLLIKKLKVMANTNGRSLNKEIEQILKWVVDDFENKRGRIRQEEIDLIENPSKKMKPMAKRTAEETNKILSDALFKLS